MLRNLLMAVCLIGSTQAIAQVSITPVQQPKAQAEIDYKQPGAPMPELRFIVFRDTITDRDTSAYARQQIDREREIERMRGRAKEKEKEGKAEGTYREKRKRKHADSGPLFAHSAVMTAKDVDNGANLFVMMFNPTCSHCENETEMLERNIDLFDRSKVLLMANPGMKPYLADFVKSLHTNNYPSIYVGIDSGDFINKAFLYQALPQINIYDKHRRLLKIYTSDVPLDSLKKYIE